MARRLRILSLPDMKDIERCVMCEKRLKPDRQHVDTCGEACYKRLLALQRALGDPNKRIDQ